MSFSKLYTSSLVHFSFDLRLVSMKSAMLSTILTLVLSLFPGRSVSSELMILLVPERSFKADALLFQLSSFANDIAWGIML